MNLCSALWTISHLKPMTLKNDLSNNTVESINNNWNEKKYIISLTDSQEWGVIVITLWQCMCYTIQLLCEKSCKPPLDWVINRTKSICSSFSIFNYLNQVELSVKCSKSDYDGFSWFYSRRLYIEMLEMLTFIATVFEGHYYKEHLSVLWIRSREISSSQGRAPPGTQQSATLLYVLVMSVLLKMYKCKSAWWCIFMASTTAAKLLFGAVSKTKQWEGKTYT